MHHEIMAEPLACEAFRPFGQVVAAPDDRGRPVNAGMAVRHDLPGHLRHRTGAALPSLAIYRCRPQPLPVAVPLLERHPLTSQTFLPLGAARWLVIVAPAGPDGSPVPTAARAFLAEAGQGISYAPGTWHSPLVALDRAGDFAMLMWETGGSRDCEELRLAVPLLVRSSPC
ncbi:ureidoglycolate lyase [Benzoatithermus flavus]|uniref:Ureidoglycolate lyase n=1 Tax=Benzoatithermus flavus TaxID=3108223 RepID=A0ABU8XT00_9PROT